MTEPSSQDIVQSLAETIAREVTARQPSSGAPVVVEVADLAATYNGTFTLAIKYQTTTYTLSVTIPTKAGGTYDFKLTSLEDGSKDAPLTIGEFTYTAADNWSVDVGLPKPIQAGPITIQTLELKITATPTT